MAISLRTSGPVQAGARYRWLGLALVIVTGVLARRRMRRVFSEFWHGVVGRLR